MCQREWPTVTVKLTASCTQNYFLQVRLMTGLLGNLNALL